MLEGGVSSLQECLSKSNIKLVKDDNFNDILGNITEDKVLEQIDTMYLFHKSLLNCNESASKLIPNKIGKTVEKYKMRIKNLKRDLKTFKARNSLNQFENMVIQSSDSYLNRAEKCIDIINHCNYIGLVKRSMRRFEICLGNTYFDNLRKSNEIEIKNLKKCAYNMLEMDGVYLINRLKRNGSHIDLEKIINYFCKVEGFDNNSNNFIKALVSYPHVYMKCCERYRLSKKQWDINEYVMSLNRAVEQDGDSILSNDYLL